MTLNPDSNQISSLTQSPEGKQPITPGFVDDVSSDHVSSLEDHKKVGIEHDWEDDAKSVKTVKTTKSVTFDKSANERGSQTEIKTCGRIISYEQSLFLRDLQNVHRTATIYTDRKRDAKAAEKEFTKAKNIFKSFKQLDTNFKWSYSLFLIVND